MSDNQAQTYQVTFDYSIARHLDGYLPLTNLFSTRVMLIAADKDNPALWTFLPCAKYETALDSEDGDVWHSRFRQSAKPAKILRQCSVRLAKPAEHLGQWREMYNKPLPDDEIKAIADMWAKLAGQLTADIDSVRIVKGEDIRYWYLEDRYENRGTLGSSCMRFKKCQAWFDIYTDNPDDVQMAIIVRDGKLTARSLVWQTDKGTVHDRIYYATAADESAMFAYFAKMGYPDAYNNDEEYTVDVSSDCYPNGYPYMDTFRFFDTRGMKLRSHREYGVYPDLLQALDGDGPGAELVPEYTCANCDCAVDEDEVCTTNYGTVYCSDCAVYSEYTDDYILAEDAVYVEFSRRYSGYMPIDNAIQVDGDWYHPDSDRICETEDGDWYLVDDTATTEDGYCYHVDDVVVTEDGYCYHVDDCILDGNKNWQLASDCQLADDGQYYLRSELTLVDGKYIY